MTQITRVRVAAFGGPEGLITESTTSPAASALRPREVGISVTHASLGSTDTLARSGGYLLQPRPGFTPGYDFIGEITGAGSAVDSAAWPLGTRVAGVLPRMGSLRSHLAISPERLVRVPASLSSAVAATLPLDLLTAGISIDLAGDPRSVLVQGISGAVGSLLAQHYRGRRIRVLGTASERSRDYALGLTPDVVDYRDPEWIARIRELVPGGVDAAFDHTGSWELRGAVARGGSVVRLAFDDGSGHARRGIALGGARSAALSLARPRERVCSVPVMVATRPQYARERLALLLERVAAGNLTPPSPEVYPLSAVREASAAVSHTAPGSKIVVEFPAG